MNNHLNYHQLRVSKHGMFHILISYCLYIYNFNDIYIILLSTNTDTISDTDSPSLILIV